jgi:hypothetical protein
MKSVLLDATATSDARRPIAMPETTNRACFIKPPEDTLTPPNVCSSTPRVRSGFPKSALLSGDPRV